MAINDQLRSEVPRVPGIIEGSMTVNRGPDGSVSLHVIIGKTGGGAEECSLLELIISAEHITDVNQVLASHTTETTGKGQQFPCHIGFSRNAVSTAA